MDLTYNGGEIDPKGFVENMPVNCNGNENHHQTEEKVPANEEAQPTYADAFPPLPTAPNDQGTASTAMKWGKSEIKSVAKTVQATTLTQVRRLVIKSLITREECSGNITL